MKSTIISLCTLMLAASAAATPLAHQARGFVLQRQASNSTAGAADGTNLQTFTGTLGGAAPPVVNNGDAKRPFTIDGDTFVNLNGALGRSCDRQKNACASLANSGDATVTSVAQCDDQNAQCHAAFA
ncbi:hypothetical protein N0V93_006718 [Gnomoniopsis smithogilvyi]|uniref:Uncharacterized protein n=1 Tax=Gnomoniopsis smithogilvyi TaxID=1191159 RepID=A0A9W9CUQ9_9PEZI|nr:hypothetical protein N0V93_006718 [Gnomoniopsis smithogilvyi]